MYVLVPFYLLGEFIICVFCPIYVCVHLCLYPKNVARNRPLKTRLELKHAINPNIVSPNRHIDQTNIPPEPSTKPHPANHRNLPFNALENSKHTSTPYGYTPSPETPSHSSFSSLFPTTLVSLGPKLVLPSLPVLQKLVLAPPSRSPRVLQRLFRS